MKKIEKSKNGWEAFNQTVIFMFIHITLKGVSFWWFRVRKKKKERKQNKNPEKIQNYNISWDLNTEGDVQTEDLVADWSLICVNLPQCLVWGWWQRPLQKERYEKLCLFIKWGWMIACFSHCLR